MVLYSALTLQIGAILRDGNRYDIAGTRPYLCSDLLIILLTLLGLGEQLLLVGGTVKVDPKFAGK